MVFLDTEKKVWKIKDLEIPVKENIPMKDMRWFKDNLTEKNKLLKENKLTDADITDFEDEWDRRVLDVGLGTTYEKIEETGISAPEFRELIAEVFTFLKAFGTIERAKQSGLYGQTEEKTEKKQ